ncbi:MAG: VIT domain-containing protein [Betaproteobacteria bacterium]
MKPLTSRTISFAAAVLVGCLSLASPAFAQLQPTPSNIWIPPRLVIPVRTDLPVQMQSVRIRAEVSGRLAFTELELTFFNPNARVLEGELQFPLLDGQSVASFAMDVNGAMREAVPVDKARGQMVFEEVIRGRIDPALLEVTQGNSFKLRVYPIPASGTKRVVLRINEMLSERKGRLAYRMPIEYADKVGTFSFDLNVAGVSVAPRIASQTFGPLPFNRGNNGFRAQFTRSDFAGRGVLDVEIAATRTPQISTQVFEGRQYFHADIPLASVEAPRAIPNLVGLIWDSSGSGAARDHGREFALLDAYFKKMRNGEVRLTRIRDIAERTERFAILNGNWRKLRDALTATAYDGATNLGAIVPDAEVREVLLFSDGLANYADQPIPAMRVPLYAVSAAVKSDPVMLRHLAHCSGGRFIDLNADAPAEAARKITFAVTRVASVDADGAQQLVMTSPYAGEGRISIAGVLTENATTLRANVVNPNGRTSVIEIPLNGGSSSSSLAAALWARMRIAELEGAFDFNRAEIRRLGRAFGLVTRETSLIVLDRIEDYVRYEIVPPTEMRADYQRMLTNAAQQRTAERKSHLDNVVRMFVEKTTWWNRDFPKSRPAKKEVAISMGAVAGNLGELSVHERQENRADVRDLATANAPTAAPASSAPQTPRVMAAKTMMAPPVYAPPASGVTAPAETKISLPPAKAGATSASIQLQKWQPDSPYAARLRNAATADMYRIYLDEKPGYLNSTAFYLDAADLFFDKGLNALGTRILSNLAEMDLENRHILRILGYRLMQAGQAKAAIPVFKKVLVLSPEEPQSYRDLGLAYAANKETQLAINTLYEVVIRPWHGRFPEIELITLADLNSIVATAKSKPDTSRIDPRLLKNLPLDLRVVLTWDADNTDIDLWVTDPDGEKAYYGHRLTYQGGRMSLDFTGGYGPEEFSLKQAKPGKYKVEAQYFGARSQNVTGATTLQVKLATKFGTPEQQEQIVTMRLKGQQEVVFVGEFEMKEKP